MKELAPPQDNSEIPYDWEIPNKSACSVVQIDLPQKFISVSYPPNLGVDTNDATYKGEYAEYFIGPSGKPANFLRHNTFDTFGQFLGDGLIVDFFVHEWHGPVGNANLDLTFKQLVPAPTMPITALGHLRYESQYFGDNPSPLAALRSVSLGEAFHPLSTTLNAPSVLLGTQFRTQGLTTEEWKVSPLGNHNGYEMNSPTNDSVVFKKGDVEYSFSWKVVDGLLIARQENLSIGLTKKLTAPLTVDMIKVGQAIFSRGPYPKDKDGFYEIPWLNVAKIANSSLTYEETY